MSIGVAPVDEQHCGIVALYNDFVGSLQADGGGERNRRILEELGRYAAHHFDEEEKVMAAIGYPLINHHHHLHRGFRRTVRNMAAGVRQPGFALGVARFLNTWIVNHITVEDADLKRYL